MESYLEYVKKQHEKFINYQEIDTTKIPQEIIISWQRCRDMQVNPYDGTGKKISDLEITRRRKVNKELINITKPLLQDLYGLVAGSGFVVNLIDQEGYILEVYGDPEVLTNARKLNFDIGSNWSEDKVGTNAIGTALAINKPIQVLGPEHYCLTHHSWTCSSCPIHDAEGQVIGVLNMSGDCSKVHSHTLGMVVAAVHSIENQLKVLRKSQELELINQKLFAIIEATSDGLIAVNSKGIITHLNSILAQQLNIDPREQVGKNIYTLGFKLELENIIAKKRGYHDQETQIQIGKNLFKYYVTASLIWNKESDKVDGVVFSFKELKKARKFVNRMVAARASYFFKDFLTQDKKVKELIKLGQKAASSTSNVLLLGESGTGKEIFAQSIHNESYRSNEPFIAVNCAAIPRDLIESELFGYEGGAFSGAKREGNPGKFELAHGGTLLLDEIGEMPLELQAKLLRVLQEKKITRIGGIKPIVVDVRIIASTNKDLLEAVQKKNFREDLYYRLNVLTINLPPLRNRKEDIPLLINYFLKKYNYLLGKNAKQISQEAMSKLLSYEWPGNVRELQNVLERAINMVEGEIIHINHLPQIFADKKIRSTSDSFPRSLTDVEVENIKKALDYCAGNITQTAKLLNIGRNTLYRKLKEYNIKYEIGSI